MHRENSLQNKVIDVYAFIYICCTHLLYIYCNTNLSFLCHRETLLNVSTDESLEVICAVQYYFPLLHVGRLIYGAKF